MHTTSGNYRVWWVWFFRHWKILACIFFTFTLWPSFPLNVCNEFRSLFRKAISMVGISFQIIQIEVGVWNGNLSLLRRFFSSRQRTWEGLGMDDFSNDPFTGKCEKFPKSNEHPAKVKGKTWSDANIWPMTRGGSNPPTTDITTGIHPAASDSADALSRVFHTKFHACEEFPCGGLPGKNKKKAHSFHFPFDLECGK